MRDGRTDGRRTGEELSSSGFFRETVSEEWSEWVVVILSVSESSE